MLIIRTTTRVLLGLCLIGLFQSAQIYAQGNNPAAINQAQPAQLEAFGFRALGGRMNERNSSNVEGSPYLGDEARPGTLYFEDGQEFRGPTRYDLINHTLLIRYHDYWTIVDPRPVVRFELQSPEGDTLHFRKASSFAEASVTQEAPGAFWQVLSAGEYTLLVQHRKTFTPAKNSVSYGRTTQKNAAYEDKSPYYYLMTPEGRLDRIKLRRGWLLTYFSEYKSELKGLIKREQLILSRAEDVRRMITWLDTQE
jgi:hypothetical protein